MTTATTEQQLWKQFFLPAKSLNESGPKHKSGTVSS